MSNNKKEMSARELADIIWNSVWTDEDRQVFIEKTESVINTYLDQFRNEKASSHH